MELALPNLPAIQNLKIKVKKKISPTKSMKSSPYIPSPNSGTTLQQLKKMLQRSKVVDEILSLRSNGVGEVRFGTMFYRAATYRDMEKLQRLVEWKVCLVSLIIIIFFFLIIYE